MEDGSINNEQITASDYYGTKQPWNGRLNFRDFWMAKTIRPTDPWIQVDLLKTTTVVGIKIQGGGKKYWVTALKLQTGESENALTFIMEDNAPKVRELKF